MPENLLASMDLPAPGGPIMMRLCPPDAAISRALLATAWPFTSEKSGPHPASSRNSAFFSHFSSSHFSSSQPTTDLRSEAQNARIPDMKASALLAHGTTADDIPLFRDSIIIGRIPATGFRDPSNATSPAKTQFLSLATAFSDICPEAAIIPRAIGRAK